MNFDQRRGSRHQKKDKHQRRNYEEPETTKEDAEKMGFNFSKNGPPRFKNDKKKE